MRVFVFINYVTLKRIADAFGDISSVIVVVKGSLIIPTALSWIKVAWVSVTESLSIPKTTIWQAWKLKNFWGNLEDFVFVRSTWVWWMSQAHRNNHSLFIDKSRDSIKKCRFLKRQRIKSSSVASPWKTHAVSDFNVCRIIKREFVGCIKPQPP